MTKERVETLGGLIDCTADPGIVGENLTSHSHRGSTYRVLVTGWGVPLSNDCPTRVSW